MKRSILLSALAFIGLLHLAAQTPANVYFTSEISPASLLRIYHALGVEATGRVAIKISTGNMYPQIICHVMGSVDGRLLTDRWTEPFGGKSARTAFSANNGGRSGLAAV